MTGRVSGRLSPPASSAGVNPRRSSSRASGLPLASATIWSRTRSSSRPGTADASSRRASPLLIPSTDNSGSPISSLSSLGSRRAKTRATGSASRRRAANARACADARSSHCASSTMQTSGCSAATSDSSVRTARPTRNRSGAAPSRSPKAVRSASRCGPGRSSSRSSIGAQIWWRPAKAISISDSMPAARTTRQSDATPRACSNRAVLPTPDSPRRTRTELRPARTPATSCSSASHSRCRPINAEPGSRPGTSTARIVEAHVLPLQARAAGPRRGGPSAGRASRVRTGPVPGTGRGLALARSVIAGTTVVHVADRVGTEAK